MRAIPMLRRAARPCLVASPRAERHAMSNVNVLSCEDLRAITGYQRAADIERCLAEQGVKTFRGRCGPWTTIDLINQAGGLTPHAENDDTYDSNIL